MTSDIQSIFAAAGSDMVAIRVSNLVRRHGYTSCREALDAEGPGGVRDWRGVGPRILGIIEQAAAP